jgi:hypothetical protein
MRSDVWVWPSSATEVVLLRKLGKNEVAKTSYVDTKRSYIDTKIHCIDINRSCFDTRTSCFDTNKNYFEPNIKYKAIYPLLSATLSIIQSVNLIST